MQNMCCRFGERHDLKRVNWSKRYDSIAFTSCTRTDYKNMKCISEGGVFEALLFQFLQFGDPRIGAHAALIEFVPVPVPDPCIFDHDLVILLFF